MPPSSPSSRAAAAGEGGPRRPAGAPNERHVAVMDWPEVAAARAIGAPPMARTVRPSRMRRDRIVG